MGREEIKNQIKSIPGSDTSVFRGSWRPLLKCSFLSFAELQARQPQAYFYLSSKQNVFKMLRVLLGEIVSCQFNIYILFV